ncbi:uncharacterized protein LOC128884494 [Hylaeus volcanicus]|uniref:uncharacterized protein LOC128884494 n=1 Tax=Hylaeus volcanicus TaxID=313075 RepID=UPI0023B86290|nr:uncharacterized protein LOC128884494 [Hylaeus volcanicus]
MPLHSNQKETCHRFASMAAEDSRRVCCMIDEHKYISCLYLELHSDGIVSIGYISEDISTASAYKKNNLNLNDLTDQTKDSVQAVQNCHFFDTLEFSKKNTLLFSPHSLTATQEYFVQSTKQKLFYENMPLPKFSYTVWLPLHIYPPIVLAVEKDSNSLLCFELMIPYAANSPYFRLIPFTGNFPSSFVQTNYFMQGHPQTPKNFLSSIHQVHVVPLQENRCLIFLLIHLKTHESNFNTMDSSEYHLILFICSTVIKNGITESLLLEKLFDGFLTCLSSLPSTLLKTNVTPSFPIDSNHLLVVPSVTIWDTVIPNNDSLFTCFATYPILDGFPSPDHITHDPYVGIYQIHDSVASVLAYANLENSEFETFHTVMALCLSKDTLVILTAQRHLLFYNLLEFQPFRHLPSSSIDLLLHQMGTSLDGDRLSRKDYYFIKCSQTINLNDHFLNSVNFLSLKYQEPVLKETPSSSSFQPLSFGKKKSLDNKKNTRLVNETSSDSLFLHTTPHLGRSSLLKIRSFHLTLLLLVSLELPLSDEKTATIPFIFIRHVNRLKKKWIPYYQLSPNVEKTKNPVFLPGTVAWNSQYSLSLFIRPIDFSPHSNTNNEPLPLLHLQVQDVSDSQMPPIPLWKHPLNQMQNLFQNIALEHSWIFP